MILIFAVDKNWGIGFAGKMLASIPDDLNRFRMITEGNIVIMGRRTLEAIPGQGPLPNRINILVTSNNDFQGQGFHIIDSLDDLFPLLQEINPNNEKQVFVTGGESIVRQLMPYCNKAYITKIDKSFDDIDTSIPSLDLDPSWKIVDESKTYKYNDLYYRYVDYIRIDS